MKDLTAKRLSAWHRRLFRATRGTIGRRLVNNDMLLLTTIGHVSGRAHTVPLLYLRDDDRLVVIASWGGRDYPPHWYTNLKANPAVSLQILGETMAATASEADGDTRELWWPTIVEAYDGYANYQSKTDRVIPVIFLDPESDPSETKPGQR